MNKRLTLFLAIILLISCLTACVTKNPSFDNSTPSEPSETELGPGISPNEFGNPSDNTIESTDGEEIDSTNPSADVTDATESSNGTEQTEESTMPSGNENDPTENTTPSSTEGSNGNTLSANAAGYAAYIAMSGEEQTAFINSFESPIAFMEWLAIARAEYEAQNPGVDVGDGNIDLGGGNG